MTIQELGKQFRNYFGFNPPIDMVSTMIAGSKNAVIDIIKLDGEFSKRDPDYNAEKCTYKELKDVSPSSYIKLKYGQEAHDFVKDNI